MIAVLINGAVILLAGLIGSRIGGKIPDKMRLTLSQAMGLCVMLIGLRGALVADDILILIVSLALGAIIGELIGIEDHLQRLGRWVQQKVSATNNDNSFANGLVTASLIFCVGAMAIVGSFEAGLNQDYTTLFAKSIIDAVTALVLASTLGVGVAFSGVSVILYQGFFTLLAVFIRPWLSDTMIQAMGSAGGVLVVAIGLNLMQVTKFRIGNLLPAIFTPVLVLAVLQLF